MTRPKRDGRQVAPKIFLLRITLLGSEPPIWRRVAVQGDVSLFELHQIIQVAMGWENYHLHEFTIKGQNYGDPDNELDLGPSIVNDKQILLQQVISRARAKFHYLYDFGDDWQHEIVVEKITAPEEGRRYPFCLGGARACPPEDCGGIWGYEELLHIISDPNHPEHHEHLEWLGGPFDPEAFDLETVNKLLARCN